MEKYIKLTLSDGEKLRNAMSETISVTNEGVFVFVPESMLQAKGNEGRYIKVHWPDSQNWWGKKRGILCANTLKELIVFVPEDIYNEGCECLSLNAIMKRN